MSCTVGGRRGSDLALLWLWRRSVATAPNRPLAWKPPYATGVVPKRQKKKKKNPPPFAMGGEISEPSSEPSSCQLKQLELRFLLDG